MTHANAPAAIAVRGLRKSYGDQVVLDGVDLEVNAGTICALLRPNGAGKTTMVSVLATLIRADGGEIQVAGYELPAQPFTPVINAVRDLLLASPSGDNVIVAVGWSAGIGLASYLSARRLYNEPTPA